VRRLLILPLLAAIALPAAGCGGSGAPRSLVDCRESTTRGNSEDAIDVAPRTFDCLTASYRSSCRAARAHIGAFGIDSGDELVVRVYRRGHRCTGDVTDTAMRDAAELEPVSAGCRLAYVFKARLMLYGCGKIGDVVLARGQDCTQLREHLRQVACRRAGVKCKPLPQPARPVWLAC
jgi:hypothetical protein